MEQEEKFSGQLIILPEHEDLEREVEKEKATARQQAGSIGALVYPTTS